MSEQQAFIIVLQRALEGERRKAREMQARQDEFFTPICNNLLNNVYLMQCHECHAYFELFLCEDGFTCSMCDKDYCRDCSGRWICDNPTCVGPEHDNGQGLCNQCTKLACKECDFAWCKQCAIDPAVMDCKSRCQDCQTFIAQQT